MNNCLESCKVDLGKEVSFCTIPCLKSIPQKKRSVEEISSIHYDTWNDIKAKRRIKNRETAQQWREKQKKQMEMLTNINNLLLEERKSMHDRLAILENENNHMKVQIEALKLRNVSDYNATLSMNEIEDMFLNVPFIGNITEAANVNNELNSSNIECSVGKPEPLAFRPTIKINLPCNLPLGVNIPTLIVPVNLIGLVCSKYIKELRCNSINISQTSRLHLILNYFVRIFIQSCYSIITIIYYHRYYRYKFPSINKN